MENCSITAKSTCGRPLTNSRWKSRSGRIASAHSFSMNRLRNSNTSIGKDRPHFRRQIEGEKVILNRQQSLAHGNDDSTHPKRYGTIRLHRACPGGATSDRLETHVTILPRLHRACPGGATSDRLETRDTEEEAHQRHREFSLSLVAPPGQARWRRGASASLNSSLSLVAPPGQARWRRGRREILLP